MSSPSPEALSWVHANRLRAAARELEGLAAEILAIARDGVGSAHLQAAPTYAPLAPEVTGRLAEMLGEVTGAAQRVGGLVGTAPPARETQGARATVAAVSARLGRLEDSLKDLRPERLQAKYGAMPEAVCRELTALCDAMDRAVRDARAVIASL